LTAKTGNLQLESGSRQ